MNEGLMFAALLSGELLAEDLVRSDDPEKRALGQRYRDAKRALTEAMQRHRAPQTTAAEPSAEPTTKPTP